MDRYRILAENGTVPVSRLEKAKEDLLDKQDEALITRALYGKDVTADQASETVAAAKRRLERRRKALAEQSKDSPINVATQQDLNSHRDDIDRAQKDLDWAIARRNLVFQVAAMAQSEAAMLKSLEVPPVSDREKARRKATQVRRIEDARAASAKLRSTCHLIYSQTASKKVVDLTVVETRQIHACDVLHLYNAGN